MSFITWKNFFIVLSIGFLWLGTFILATNLSIYLSTKQYIFDESSAAPVAQTVLIPGAAVSADGELTPIFIDRVDLAIELYEAKKVTKILVSGDNSTLSYNEVSPVRTYLLNSDIPEADIFLDHAGFDTYSSMYRARDIFGVTSVLISTQEFHLPRAVFIARKLGLEAYGVNADVGYIFKRNYIRELLANEKAIIDLFWNRKPKFLGEQILIDGPAQEL